MAKFYCSKCGIELIHTRKAVPGKGLILDLISPHECEGYAIKDKPDGEMTALEIIEATPKLGEFKKAESQEVSTGIRNPGDRRGATSTAPNNLLKDISNFTTSGGDLD